MAENGNNALGNALSIANAVRGAVKTGKAIAAAAKGGAAGGAVGAAAAFAFENRRLIAAVIMGLTVILLLPAVIISMLPSLIFGGTNSSDLNNPAAVTENIQTATGVINTMFEENLKKISEEIEKDKLEGIKSEIVYPQTPETEYTAALIISQYCAAREKDYKNISLPDFERTVKTADNIYRYEKTEETRTVETAVTVVNAKKAIYVDEMWQLIGSGGNQVAAGFVLEMFKIIRGYGGSAICATQDLNDFFALDGGKYGKGIINNCKTKIILNLEDDEAERVKDIFKLSEAEIMEITHFERGSGLISTNNNNITVEFKCSELEKRLITTDRRELKQILDGEKADMRS